MPSKSKNQKTAAMMALAAKKGMRPKEKLKGASKSMMAMSVKQLTDMKKMAPGAPKKMASKPKGKMPGWAAKGKTYKKK